MKTPRSNSQSFFVHRFPRVYPESQNTDTDIMCGRDIHQICSTDMPAILLNDRQGYTRCLDPNRTCVPMEMYVGDRPLRFTISYLNRPVTLAELVPMAWQLADRIIEAIGRNIHESDRRISCRKGCSSCCRYLIPITTAEAYHIRNEIYNQPASEQRTLLRACQIAAQKLIGRKIPSNLFSTSCDFQERLTCLSDWYKELDLPCPFLVNHCCCIYEFRPLVCREYLVTTHPTKCLAHSAEKARKVILPVSVAEVMAETCCQTEEAEPSILLPLLVPFLQANAERSWKLYPPDQLISTFLDTLTRRFHRNFGIECEADIR